MHKLLLALILMFLPLPCFGQTNEWTPIKELTGFMLSRAINTSMREIARSDDGVKLLIRFDFPDGAPPALFTHVPAGFDMNEIVRVEGRLKLDCETMTVIPMTRSVELFTYNGTRFKSKETPFNIASGNLFAQYFCEQGESPTQAPTLKPRSDK